MPALPPQAGERGRRRPGQGPRWGGGGGGGVGEATLQAQTGPSQEQGAPEICLSGRPGEGGGSGEGGGPGVGGGPGEGGGLAARWVMVGLTPQAFASRTAESELSGYPGLSSKDAGTHEMLVCSGPGATPPGRAPLDTPPFLQTASGAASGTAGARPQDCGGAWPRPVHLLRPRQEHWISHWGPDYQG